MWRHLHEPVRICAFAMNAAAKLSETSPNYRRTFSRSGPGGCASRLLKQEDWETEAKEETFERQRGRLAGERATSESWNAGRADAFRCNLSQDIFFLSGAPWQR